MDEITPREDRQILNCLSNYLHQIDAGITWISENDEASDTSLFIKNEANPQKTKVFVNGNYIVKYPFSINVVTTNSTNQEQSKMIEYLYGFEKFLEKESQNHFANLKINNLIPIAFCMVSKPFQEMKENKIIYKAVFHFTYQNKGGIL